MIATAKREEHQLALMFIDLDDFKRINDPLGHDAGDELLMEAARRMNRCIRDTDYAARNSDENSVARLGGDEFTILLRDGNSAEEMLKHADIARYEASPGAL